MPESVRQCRRRRLLPEPVGAPLAADAQMPEVEGRSVAVHEGHGGGEVVDRAAEGARRWGTQVRLADLKGS